MKLVNRFFVLFVIVEVSSQIDVLEIGDDVRTNDRNREVENDPLDFDILADETFDALPSIDYFLGEEFHDRGYQEHGIETLGDAHADPTLHKWKHKLPLFHGHTHSHIHSISHGNPHGIETAAVVYPVNHQFSHQSQNVHSYNKQFSTIKGQGNGGPVVVYPADHQFSQHSQSGHSLNNQFSSQQYHGINSNNPPVRPIFNQWDKGSPQTQHSTNQNSNQFINHLNAHQTNPNNHMESFDSSGRIIYPSDTFNPGIVNINGHSNTVIQSGTSKKFISSHNGQVFSHESSGPFAPNREDHLIGISMPAEEQSYWHIEPHGSDSPMSSGEASSAAVYDKEMNNILDILDERSYQMTRPEIEASSKQKHSEDAIRNPDVQMNGLSGGNNHLQEEKQREQNGYNPGDGEIDYNLESPSLIQIPHNNYFHSYDYRRNSRNKRSPKDINMKLLSDNSMNFNISSWRLKEMNSKLNDTLLGYYNIVDDYRKKITDKRESIFVDLLDSIIGQFQRKEYENSNEIKKIEKRSATITKLLNNPDARLDVPKTLDNIGTITRNAFEDERSPMYHVRQFIGSTKNAVMSAMKIPPQNLVIPSNYEIKNIKPEEISDVEDNMVSGINPKILSRSGFGNTESMGNYEEPYSHDPYGIVETFARVGGAIRDSVRSGQNTLNHISDIAHNARKIYQTTKNSAPRILLPYARAPVLRSRFKGSQTAPLKKAIVISPKVLAVKDPVLGSSKVEQDFVSMGHILDAIGLTKPDKDQIDLEKIVFRMPGQGETRGIYIPPMGEVKSINGRNLPNARQANDKIKKKSKIQLDRMQEKVASTNQLVKDGLIKMRNDISKTLDTTKNRMNEKNTDVLQMKQRNNIEEDLDAPPQTTLQNDTSNFLKWNKIKHFTKEEENEIIDKFLNNIFKTETNSKGANSVNISKRIAENAANRNRTTMSSNETEKEDNESILASKNNIAISDILPNITETFLQETIKNITLDILKDEEKNTIPKMTNSQSKKIRKQNLRLKKKLDAMKKPKIVLKSRFGDDEGSDTFTTTSPNNSSVLEFKGVDNSDEEAMRKVDEYILSDVAAPQLSDYSNKESVKNSFKLGDILELIEEPSAEESSVEPRSEEIEAERVPAFSSRNLLWIPEVEDDQEKIMVDGSENIGKPLISEETERKDMVGLNLPPELMTPFMSRASNTDVNELFGREEVQAKSEDANDMMFNIPSQIMVGSPKEDMTHSFNNEDEKTKIDPPGNIGQSLISEKTEGKDRVGLNLPPELMTPFMSRASNSDIDEVFGNDEIQGKSVDSNERSFNLPSEMLVGSSKSDITHFPSNGRRDFDENIDEEERVGLNLPPELMKPFMARASDADRDKAFTSEEDKEYNGAVNDNNEMQSYLPILMMPLRTTKSVKKTLDEFLKKENETSQQILNTQENRLKTSRPDYHSQSSEGGPHHFKEQLHPSRETIISDGNNCKTNNCYGRPVSVQSNYQTSNFQYDGTNNSGENVMICAYISEDSDDPIQHNEFPGHYRHSEDDEMNELIAEDASKGVGQARTSMAVSDNLRKPFMGLGNEDTIKKFYEEYNGKHEEDEGDLFGSDEERMLFSDE